MCVRHRNDLVARADCVPVPAVTEKAGVRRRGACCPRHPKLIRLQAHSLIPSRSGCTCTARCSLHDRPAPLAAGGCKRPEALRARSLGHLIPLGPNPDVECVFHPLHHRLPVVQGAVLPAGGKLAEILPEHSRARRGLERHVQEREPGAAACPQRHGIQKQQNSVLPLNIAGSVEVWLVVFPGLVPHHLQWLYGFNSSTHQCGRAPGHFGQHVVAGGTKERCR
mmetsp:Transcript_26114/g.67310  ORF Transcript_26114/g.67310 Transcript_26114/m.67310 type:complete len:223 (-) Transcript_26114:994-1662(-)